MKKAMISQPMKGKTKEQIRNEGAIARDVAKLNGYEVVNTYFEDFNESNCKNVPLRYLSKSLEAMSECDALIVCPGWNSARGCMIEVMSANAYGLDVLFIGE